MNRIPFLFCKYVSNLSIMKPKLAGLGGKMYLFVVVTQSRIYSAVCAIEEDDGEILLFSQLVIASVVRSTFICAGTPTLHK